MKQTETKVLMFGWELAPENSGGLGVACYGLAKGLADCGVKISFALPRKMKGKVNFMKILDHKLHGVQITAIRTRMGAYMFEGEYQAWRSRGMGEELKMYGKTLFDEAMRFGEMAVSWSKSQNHDVIHVHDWMTYPAGINARKVSGRPLVAHVHATEYDRTGGNVNSMIADAEYRGLNSADRVIAVSEYTKNVVRKYYGVDGEKIHVVHNGVDFDEFTPVVMRKLFPKSKVALYVGRLTFQKGVEYFLRAARRVLVYEPNIMFVVVGEGDMYERLMWKACELGVGHRVVFAGFQTGLALRACYQMADVFVMPSVSEPYGIVALEAIASGIPAVISKQSGVSETVENVFKVDFWDTEKMADMITTILAYPKLAKEMSRMAKREAAKLTWNEAARKTLAVYRELL